ncbi:type II toxin-antitoxin system HicB family antitoxin [Campylobacter hyointestinalis]|nr:type II toxin-antitoxin system HicB family antitoxin [Campylobacter hyointestinalis]
MREAIDENKKVRVNVSLSQEVLNSIESVSKNRSAFLEKAALMA